MLAGRQFCTYKCLKYVSIVHFSACKNVSKCTFFIEPEPILPIRRIRKLRRAPETPLALIDYLIFVLFFNLATGYENMNDKLL